MPRPERADGEFQLLDPILVAPSPVNPRKVFDEESMVELTDSVREKGVRLAINVRPVPEGSWYIEPGRRDRVEGWFLTDRRRFFMRKDPFIGSFSDYHHLPWELFENFYVERAEAEAHLPKWEIIAGERRWRAARRAGLTQIRAIVEDMDDEQAAELQVIENEQRKDLSPLETAAGYQYLLSLPGYSMQKLSKHVGKSANTLHSKLKILNLPEPLQQALARGVVATVTAERIGRLEPEVQARVATEIFEEISDDGNISDRDAQAIIESVKHEKTREDMQAAVAKKLEAEGFTVLKGEQARGVLSYGDTVAHNAGYVAVNDPCPRDPHGATWKEIVEQSALFMEREHLFVCKYAVVAPDRTDGYKGVGVYSRDQVNSLLKALGMWEAEGSQVTKEREAKAAAKEAQGRAWEEMMNDLDALRRQVEKERSPRWALLAAVWAATGDFCDDDAARFVAKRRLWISADDEGSENVNSIVRSLASDLDVRELQALVVELSVAQMDLETRFYAAARTEIRGLVDPDPHTDYDPGEEAETAGARTNEEPAEAATV